MLDAAKPQTKRKPSEPLSPPMLARKEMWHILRICRDMAHQHKMPFTVWQIEVAMQSLDDMEQAMAVQMVDRSIS